MILMMMMMIIIIITDWRHRHYWKVFPWSWEMLLEVIDQG